MESTSTVYRTYARVDVMSTAGNGDVNTGHGHGASQRNTRDIQGEGRPIRLFQRRSPEFGESSRLRQL